MTHFPPNTHVIYTDAESHGAALTCVCGRSGEARPFAFEDLCFPLWLSELFDRTEQTGLQTQRSVWTRLQLLFVPVCEGTWLTVFGMIVRSQSPGISLVGLCLALCLSPSHLTPASNWRGLFHLDTFRGKLKCRENIKINTLWAHFTSFFLTELCRGVKSTPLFFNHN